MDNSSRADRTLTQFSPGVPGEGSDRGFQLSHLRWLIVTLVFFATLINFIDRLTISVLAPVIREQLHLTNLQYAQIGTWFLIAYTLSQGFSGRLYDRVGTKIGFTISIVVWSAAAMGHAFVRGLGGLCACRAVLGLGEAGNWPGAAKVIAEWFPVRERALAMGVFNSGPSLGSVVAPPLIVWLQLQFGWQATFLVTGSLGFLWLVAWLLIYRPLADHPWLGDQERQFILDGQPIATDALQSWSWLMLIRYPQTWAIVLSRFLVDPVWWLYIIWLPEYLNKARGMDLKQIGMFAWVPFLSADAGSLLGGFLSGHLIRRGFSANAARKAVIIAAAVLMLACIPAARAKGAAEALLWISLVTFAFQAWINNVQTLPSDLFPQQAVASVAGMGGVGAGVGAILFTLTTGWIVDHYSYTPVLMIAGILAPAGTVVLLSLLGRIEPLSQNKAAFPISATRA